MTNLIIQVSKYLIIILMALYTLQCYTVFGKKDEDAREYLFLRQNMLMFAMHFVAFTVLYLRPMAQSYHSVSEAFPYSRPNLSRSFMYLQLQVF